MTDIIVGVESLGVTGKKLKQLREAFAQEFLNRVKDKTPVDTGRLKAGWTLEDDGSSIEGVNTAVNDRGEPYAVYVEYGHDEVPGVFMVGRTVMETDDILDVAKKKLGL